MKDIDTGLESPDDIVDWQTAPMVADRRLYRVAQRSVVVLWRPMAQGAGV